MKIKIDNFEGNIHDTLRRAGYHPDKWQRGSEMSYSRSISGGRYPRFHIYWNSDRAILNLHLDQKPATYKSSPDHGAEYDSPLVKEEAQRIMSFF